MAPLEIRHVQISVSLFLTKKILTKDFLSKVFFPEDSFCNKSETTNEIIWLTVLFDKALTMNAVSLFFVPFRQPPAELVQSGLAGQPQQSLSQYQVMHFTYQSFHIKAKWHIAGILTKTNSITAPSLSVLFQAQRRRHTARPPGGRLPSSNLPPLSETRCPLCSERFDHLLCLDFCGYLWLSCAKASQQPVCVSIHGDRRCLIGPLELTKVCCRSLFSRLNKKRRCFILSLISAFAHRTG